MKKSEKQIVKTINDIKLPVIPKDLLDALDVLFPERTPPIRVRKSVPDKWISLTLTEGKNRQVRKMTAKAGFPTLRLIRESIGPFKLKGLSSGEVRELSEEDINRLMHL